MSDLMRRPLERFPVVFFMGVLTVALAACSGDSEPAAPSQGRLAVEVVTTGDGLDADGYVLTGLPDGEERAVGINDGFTLEGVEPRGYVLTLTGIADNCEAENGSVRTVTVTAGETADASFSVTCEAPPALNLVTRTTGASAARDDDGYVVAIEPGGRELIVSSNGARTITDLAPGTYQMTLTRIAPECQVEGGASRSVEVLAETGAEVVFDVSCALLWEGFQTPGSRQVRSHFLTSDRGRAVDRSLQSNSDPLFMWTEDGGETWSSRVVSAPGDVGAAFTFLDVNRGFMTGQECQIFRTTDGGTTWTGGRICDSPRWILSIHFIDASTGFAAGGGGFLFRTDDGGVSWTPAESSFGWPIPGIHFLDPMAGVFVGSEEEGAVFRTDDGGESWTRATAPDANWMEGVDFMDGSIGVAVGRDVILRTTDGGRSWSKVRDAEGVQLWDVELGSDGFGVAVGAPVEGQGLLLVTEDGGLTWRREKSGVGTVSSVTVLGTEAWAGGNNGILLHRSPR